MKIGISAIGYECTEHLDKVLEPWEAVKNEGVEVVISASHGIFPETHSLGFPIESNDKSHEIIPAHRTIDNFTFLEEPTYEKDIRNSTLPYLFGQGFDLLWLLDLQDEIYTVKEILNIIKFVNNPINEKIEWFKINFKNYVFTDNCWIDDFIAPRVWKRVRNDGVKIKNFYYDNDIMYEDGLKAQDLAYTILPRHITFPKHLSWVGSKDYLVRKIEFQKNHYGDCSYCWNDDTDSLDFNDTYYKKFNKFKPELNYDEYSSGNAY